jgi:hypothetical protein
MVSTASTWQQVFQMTLLGNCNGTMPILDIFWLNLINREGEGCSQ